MIPALPIPFLRDLDRIWRESKPCAKAEPSQRLQLLRLMVEMPLKSPGTGTPSAIPLLSGDITPCPSTWESSTLSHQQIRRTKINIQTWCWLVTVPMSCTQTLPPARKLSKEPPLNLHFQLTVCPRIWITALVSSCSTAISLHFLFRKQKRFDTGKEEG